MTVHRLDIDGVVMDLDDRALTLTEIVDGKPGRSRSVDAEFVRWVLEPETMKAETEARLLAPAKARDDAATAVAALVDDPDVDPKLRAALAALAGVVAPEVKARAEELAGKPIDVSAETVRP